MYDVKNELTHYGILGMKWGVRRYRNPDGSLTPAGKNRQIKEQRKQDKKNRRNMSTKELTRKLARLESEKKLKELINEDTNPGRTFTNNVLKAAGKKAAVVVVSGAALYGLKAVLTKKFSAKEFAGFIAPKPK